MVDEPPAPHTDAKPARSVAGGLRAAEWISLALLLLATLGIGITDFSASRGYHYWLAMVPIFAAASLYAELSRHRGQSRGLWSVLGTIGAQLAHWGIAVAAVYLVFVLERAGRLNNAVAGLVALLVLALTTLLAGIHFDRRMLPIGILLAGAVTAAALLEEYLWVMLILVVAGLALLAWAVVRLRRGPAPRQAARSAESSS